MPDPTAGDLVADLCHFDDLLTDEERALRARVRAALAETVTPSIHRYWEKAEFPFDMVPKLAELGVAGGTISGYGCPGLGSVADGLVSLEFSRADGSVATFFGVQSGLAMAAIYHCGSEEQRLRWLPRMAKLEAIGAFALTEPDIGSDAAHLQTRARLDGDAWVLDGEKRWIGNATIADVTVVWARTDEGHVSGFLVEKDTPGFRATTIEGKASQRAVWQADIEMRDCRLPLGNRLEGARTFRDTAKVLMHSRLGVAWGALGHALACYEASLAYAKRRVQFGKPIAGYQLIQHKFVTMAADIVTGELLCWRTSILRDEGKLTHALASLAKLNNAAKARHIAAMARDIMGGNGILLENVVARHMADLEAVYSYEGSDAVNTLLVGREITGLDAFT